MARAHATGSRITELDGLRGLAALIVVLCHTILIIPALARADFFAADVGSGSFIWLLAYTPIHFLWDGTAAVSIFFVLSGLVLTLSVSAAPAARWRSYYPRRIIRLYLPAAASIAFALLLSITHDQHISTDVSPWLAAHISAPHGIDEAVREATLLNPGWLVTPLWSLKWEVIFSLALPGYVQLQRRMSAKTGTILCLALILCGYMLSMDALTYLPMFGLGVVMALHYEETLAFAARIPSKAWIVFALLLPLCLSSNWSAHGFLSRSIAGQLLVTGVCGGISALAAAGTVLLCAGCGQARTLLKCRPVKWLGKRSFSLYLIHEPLLVALALQFGGHPTPLLLFGVGLPACLVAAGVFFRAVEQPSHRLSIAVGAWLGRPTAAQPSLDVQTQAV